MLTSDLRTIAPESRSPMQGNTIDRPPLTSPPPLASTAPPLTSARPPAPTSASALTSASTSTSASAQHPLGQSCARRGPRKCAASSRWTRFGTTTASASPFTTPTSGSTPCGSCGPPFSASPSPSTASSPPRRAYTGAGACHGVAWSRAHAGRAHGTWAAMARVQDQLWLQCECGDPHL